MRPQNFPFSDEDAPRISMGVKRLAKFWLGFGKWGEISLCAKVLNTYSKSILFTFLFQCFELSTAEKGKRMACVFKNFKGI